MSVDWFYHVPASNNDKSKKEVPAASQIPGLSNVPPPEQQQSGILIRDTDSKFVRLAKQGGHKNLLIKRDFVAKDQPVPYPTPEWWGHRPSSTTDASDSTVEKRKYAVPDYMVHSNQYLDDKRQEQKDNQRSHNKIIQRRRDLLEPIKTRYRDVDNEICAGKPSRPRSAEPHPSEYHPQLPQRMKTFATQLDHSQPILSKVLNYGYQRDWLNERSKYEQDEKSRREEFLRHLAKHQHCQSEREMQPRNEAHEEKAIHDTVALQRKSGKVKPAPWRNATINANHGAAPDAANLFKMKRFSNVKHRVQIPSIA